MLLNSIAKHKSILDILTDQDSRKVIDTLSQETGLKFLSVEEVLCIHEASFYELTNEKIDSKDEEVIDASSIQASFTGYMKKHVKDMNGLKSALDKPVNLVNYSFGDFPSASEIAAITAIGIAKNHAFHDGNKRSAFSSLIVSLHKNEMTLNASPQSIYNNVLKMTSNEITNKEFTDWVKARAIRIEKNNDDEQESEIEFK